MLAEGTVEYCGQSVLAVAAETLEQARRAAHLAVVELEGGRVRAARVAYGGMAAIPVRAAGTEAALTGRPWTEATVEAAAAVLATELTPISDLRASAAYRRLAAGNLLRKFWIETAGAPARTRVLAAEGSS